MQHLEDNLQEACIYWFDLQYPKLKNLLFHVPNGGLRNKKEALRLKKQGVRSGVSDLILLKPNNQFYALLIEMKSGKGILQPNQKEWLRMAENEGYCTKVCYSFDEFKETIEKYLK